MARKIYCSLHPSETALPQDFYYGNMQVARKTLGEDSKHSRRMTTIFESYVRAGILPARASLIGDYLEHTLVKDNGKGLEIAGRYLGIILPDGSYHYIRLEGESIRVEKSAIEPPEQIDILTDTCLFCASNATATLANGETVSIVAPRTNIEDRVLELQISDHMCLYEMDAVARLTDLIRSMKEGNPVFEKAVIAMPTVEYYLYLMDAYNNNFVDRDDMIAWIQKVDHHAQRIVYAIEKRIGLKIEECQPLSTVQPYIEDRIKTGRPADFDEVKDILASGNRLWKDILAITKPRQWKELNYANYTVVVIETSLNKENRKRLVIDIENPSEQKILRNASKIAKKLELDGTMEMSGVIGIYPHEKVFIPPSEKCSGGFPRLYYLEEQQDSDACYYREILEANRRRINELPKEPPNRW